MGIENLSLRLKNAQSFTLEEMIFLFCGIDPMTLTQAEDRHLFWGVTEPDKPLNTQAQYWVTDREESDFLYVQDLLEKDKLGWIAIGMYNHDNPEIHIQESNSNPENISSVARSHQAFMNAFNRASETAKELFKVQIEGFKQTSDYKSTLKSLQTEMLIPQFIVDDLDWFTLVSGELGRDLTGAEVQAIKRVYEYEINDFWQHRAKSDKTFSKQNIASYLAAKQIESVFDFGQNAISKNAVNINSKEILESVLHTATDEHKTLFAFVQFGGVIKRNMSGWGFERINDFAATKLHGDVKTIRKAMKMALDHFDRLNNNAEQLPDEIAQLPIWIKQLVQ